MITIKLERGPQKTTQRVSFWKKGISPWLAVLSTALIQVSMWVGEMRFGYAAVHFPVIPPLSITLL